MLRGEGALLWGQNQVLLQIDNQSITRLQRNRSNILTVYIESSKSTKISAKSQTTRIGQNRSVHHDITTKTLPPLVIFKQCTDIFIGFNWNWEQTLIHVFMTSTFFFSLWVFKALRLTFYIYWELFSTQRNGTRRKCKGWPHGMQNCNLPRWAPRHIQMMKRTKIPIS